MRCLFFLLVVLSVKFVYPADFGVFKSCIKEGDIDRFYFELSKNYGITNEYEDVDKEDEKQTKLHTLFDYVKDSKIELKKMRQRNFLKFNDFFLNPSL